MFKADTSYEGELSHPDFGTQPFPVNMDLTSPTEGRWHQDGDEDESEQKFTVSHDGDRIKISDHETELNGEADANGIIKGDFVHGGREGGSFVLKPRSSSVLGAMSYKGTLHSPPGFILPGQ